MKDRVIGVLVLATAGISLFLNGREAIRTTTRCWNYRQERRQGGLAYNYGDPWKNNLKIMLDENVRPNDRIMMLDEPLPCTAAYSAYLFAAYLVCPQHLHYPGCGFDPRQADWIYFPYTENSGVNLSLAAHGVTNHFYHATTNPPGHTLLRHR